jgi:hypothetical protein
MSTAFNVTVAIVAFLMALPVLLIFLNAYRTARGKRVITCPETKEAAAVDVNAAYAAVTTLRKDEACFRLRDCSRWPERRDCGQECLRQIEAAPEGCLVRYMLANWYVGRLCVYCRKPLAEMNWAEHKPALMTPELKTVEWADVPPETLPQLLSVSLPVCWNCHIAETFRREHPDLVVDRPWRKAARVVRALSAGFKRKNDSDLAETNTKT